MLFLIACPLAFAQAGSSAVDKVNAQNNQIFKSGTIIDFYCLIASVEHPRAGVMISCVKPGGRYVMSWGNTLPGDAIHPLKGFGTSEAFEKAASTFAPNEIVHARCIVMPQQSSDQLELYCAPPVKAKQ
jgi:hypothetical protein